MSVTFLFLAALKATLLAAGGVSGALILPAAWLKARRLIALNTLWLLLLVPWISLPLETFSAGLALPATAPAISGGTWLLITLWVFGAAVHGFRLIVEWRGLREMLRQSKSHGSAAGIGIRLVPGLASPCLFGAWQACIFMPVAALDWPARQWAAVIEHELQHAQQSDGLHRIICALVRAVFWWNPLVRSLCHRVEIESELCCDRAAISALSRRAYGEMLLGLATDISWRMAPAWSSRHALRERIERLLKPGACGRCGAGFRFGVVVFLLAAALLAACCVSAPSIVPNALKTEALLRLEAEPFPGN